MTLTDVAPVLRLPLCFSHILLLVDPRAVAGSKCSTAGSFIQTIRQVPGGVLGEAKFVCSG